MENIDDILDSSKWHEPSAFHPVNNREDMTAWFPANEAASLVIQLDYIWDDISYLEQIYKKTSDDYEKKLMIKYITVEIRSYVQLLDKLQAIVMKAPVFNPSKKQGYRELTHDERSEAIKLFGSYSDAKKLTSEKIRKIRNNIGAHRSNINWEEVMSFWDELKPDVVNPLLRTMPKVFNYIKDLDLYEWTRITEKGNKSIIGTAIRPEYLE